jgi:thioester reductase-like protein
MGTANFVLLTGATGFLGRHLLRELLATGRRVAVLARARHGSAEERVRALLGPRQNLPVVLGGDLLLPDLGLSVGDRNWLARRCGTVVHAAADVSLHPAPGRDPWATNADGTRRLLELCRTLGIADLHHISTAFVCGDGPGPIREDDLDRGQGFRNDYERSKFEAERLVRSAPGLRATVYRPSLIVGDSRTGETSSYHGFYRFLELGARLAGPATATGGRRRLPLRLPFRGDERRNLVPVDWVARAVVRLLERPTWHGCTFHLTAHEAVSVRLLKEVAADVLGLDGVGWADAVAPDDPTETERAFLDRLREYWPYLDGDPEFDCRNARAVLPDLPPPAVDAALLRRLIAFAVADDWGRQPRRPRRPEESPCARYVEHFFPECLPRSELARLPVEAVVGLEVSGTGGGRWSFRLAAGAVRDLRRGAVPGVEVCYRTDAVTFAAVVDGREAAHDAFLARRIEIDGDVEKGLKLAVLFGRFVAEFPWPWRDEGKGVKDERRNAASPSLTPDPSSLFSPQEVEDAAALHL